MISLAGVVGFGCAVSDYEGYLGHYTSSQAKLVGFEVAFSGLGRGYDGTYAYSVSYDNRNRLSRDSIFKTIRIRTYQNPVPGAFTNEAAVVQDADALECSAGDLSSDHNPAIPAGSFHEKWKFVDLAPDCQFSDNYWDGTDSYFPIITLCFTAPQQEADYKDLSLLQDDFASLTEFVNRALDATPGETLPLEVEGIELNGQLRNLTERLPLYTVSSGSSIGQMMIDLSGEAGRQVKQAILDLTDHMQPVTVKLNFSGGMRFGMPNSLQFAFDHNRLAETL
ncbi:MAG: hypothetical protein MJE77_24985 [Proteobacteria bacterium]|nr:hypothetical protein [Pseudomonadota bacterium]